MGGLRSWIGLAVLMVAALLLAYVAPGGLSVVLAIAVLAGCPVLTWLMLRWLHRRQRAA